MNRVLIASLFPADVITEESWGDNAPGSLHPEEEALSHRMSAGRYREFAGGRCCARRALSRMGIHDAPILVRSDRVPIWPTGIVGSISHTDGYVGVAIARRGRVQGVGLDAEALGTADQDVWRLVCTHAELSWLGAADDEDKRRYSYLIFSAKECTYKCWYWATGQKLGFHDVHVVVDPANRLFQAEILVARDRAFPKEAVISGSYRLSGDHVFTGMVLHADDLRIL